MIMRREKGAEREKGLLGMEVAERRQRSEGNEGNGVCVRI